MKTCHQKPMDHESLIKNYLKEQHVATGLSFAGHISSFLGSSPICWVDLLTSLPRSHAAFMCCQKCSTSHFWCWNYKFVAFRCFAVGRNRNQRMTGRSFLPISWVNLFKTKTYGSYLVSIQWSLNKMKHPIQWQSYKHHLHDLYIHLAI